VSSCSDTLYFATPDRLIKDIKKQLADKSLQVAASTGCWNSMSTFIDGGLIHEADAVERAAEQCSMKLEQIEAKLMFEIAARKMAWERLDKFKSTSMQVTSVVENAMNRIEHWRHRTCDSILARMKRQQLVRGLVVWGAWACSRSSDRKLARASNCFSRLRAAFVKRAYQVWHEYVLCERSNARKGNTIMDRVESGRMITVLHALARGAARAKSRGQTLQGCVRWICALKRHENTRLKSTAIQ